MPPVCGPAVPGPLSLSILGSCPFPATRAKMLTICTAGFGGINNWITVCRPYKVLSLMTSDQNIEFNFEQYVLMGTSCAGLLFQM